MSSPIRFGYNNRVPLATLTASPSPITSLESIKSELPSRRTIWPATNIGDFISVTGRYEEPQYAQFCALPDAYKIGDAEVRMLLFKDNTDGSTTTALDTGYISFTKNIPSDLIPLGDWAAGVNAYGERMNSEGALLPETFAHFFNASILHDRFSLIIRKSPTSDVELSDVSMRMLFMGSVFQMQSSFTFPHDISYVTPPKLSRVSSGRWVSKQRQMRSRTMNVPLDYATDQDRNALWQLETSLAGKAFVVAGFPEDAEPWMLNHYTMLAHFGSTNTYKRKFFNLNENKLTLLEA